MDRLPNGERGQGRRVGPQNARPERHGKREGMAANDAALLRIESTFWSGEHAPRADALRLLQRVHHRGGIATFIAEKQPPCCGPRFQKRVDANRFTGIGYGEPARLLGRLDGIRAQALQIHPPGDGAPRNHRL